MYISQHNEPNLTTNVASKKAIKDYILSPVSIKIKTGSISYANH